MPLQKLQFRPGVDRENTRYAAEGGWYETNKVRFRRGMPQKIGGWVRLSNNSFLGICRSMLNWVTLQGQNLVSVGTNLKYYIERGGAYYDITPIRSTVSLTDPFTTTSGSATVLVTDVAHGALQNDFVTFSGATAVGGLTLNNEYQISFVSEDTYTITAETTASSTATGGGSVTDGLSSQHRQRNCGTFYRLECRYLGVEYMGQQRRYTCSHTALESG